jgi:hypothetical protein
VTLLFLVVAAMAGDGPWTLQPGDTSLYVGVDQVRYAHVRTNAGVRDLGGGVSAVSAVGVATIGLLDGFDLEAVVPWVRSRHLDPTSDLCTGPGRPSDFCATTSSLGTVRVMAKGRLLNEGNLRPVSLSIAAGVRSSEVASEARGRLTAVGEGQSDVGATVAVGRTAGVAKAGWYKASLQAGYWYRLPLANHPKIPADDLVADAAVIVSPVRAFAVGPAVSLFYRLWGTQLGEDIDLSDPNGFASLQASQLKVGGQASVFGAGGLTLSTGVYATAVAKNNPSDTLSFSVGLGWFHKKKEPAADP